MTTKFERQGTIMRLVQERPLHTQAEVAHALCREIGLPCLVKTSGSSGLHLMIPLAGQCLHHGKSRGFIVIEKLEQLPARQAVGNAEGFQHRVKHFALIFIQIRHRCKFLHY